jgi:hypothetical protein
VILSAIAEGATAFARDYAAGRAAGDCPAPALEMAWPLVDLLERSAPFSDAVRSLADFDPWTARSNQPV